METLSGLRRLRCLACERLSDGRARGWKAYVAGGYHAEEVVVGLFCPECAHREFGDTVEGRRSPRHR